MARTLLVPLAVALALPGVARGQEGLDAHGMYLAPQDGDLRDLMLIQRPGRLELGDWYAVGAIEFADDLPRRNQVAPIENTLVLNAAAGAALNDRVRLDAAAPIFLTTSGLDTPQTSQLGDMRFSSQVVLLQPDVDPRGGGLGIGLVPWVTVPTGDEDVDLGQDDIAGGVLLDGTYEWARWTVTGEGGVSFAPEEGRVREDRAELGAGVAWAVGSRTAVAAEAHVYIPLVENFGAGESPADLMASLRRVTPRGGQFFAGAGFAVRSGFGVPAFRLFLGGGFGRRVDPDPDRDFIIGAAELCPDVPETVNGWEDDDGCPDELASVAFVPYDADGEVYLQAEVRATDGDDVLVAEEGPLVLDERIPGSTWGARARYGCLVGEVEDVVVVSGDNRIGIPVERVYDADLRFVVVDERDIPLEEAVVTWLYDGPDCSPIDQLELPVGLGTATVGAGIHRIVVSAPGYASRVFRLRVPAGFDENVEVVLSRPRVTLSEDGAGLVSDHRVHFEFDRAWIMPYSYPILDEAAAMIRSSPELGLVEIAGHADERGPASYNLGLSVRRALAVRDYLISAGVAPERLVVRGYGESRPMANESSETAWALNRRVELQVGFTEEPTPEEIERPWWEEGRRPET